MRKVFFALLAVAFVTSLCYAQQAPTVAKQAPAKAAVQSKVIIGTVDSVSLADPVKGTKSEITIVNEVGQKTTFLVKVTTTIYDSASATITFDKIKKDDKVKVKYFTSAEGVNMANAIHIVQ